MVRYDEVVRLLLQSDIFSLQDHLLLTSIWKVGNQKHVVRSLGGGSDDALPQADDAPEVEVKVIGDSSCPQRWRARWKSVVASAIMNIYIEMSSGEYFRVFFFYWGNLTGCVAAILLRVNFIGKDHSFSCQGWKTLSLSMRLSITL